jgi:photosystem II stability/assembly factor-like uncharacterized protein
MQRWWFKIARGAAAVSILAGGTEVISSLGFGLAHSDVAFAASPSVGGTYSCATPLGTKKIPVNINDLNSAPSTLVQGTTYLAQPQMVATVPGSLIRIVHAYTGTLKTLKASAATLQITAVGFSGPAKIATNNTPVSLPIDTTTIAHGATATLNFGSTPYTVTPTSGTITLTPGNVTLRITYKTFVLSLQCFPPSETIDYTKITTDGSLLTTYTEFTISGSNTLGPIDSTTAVPDLVPPTITSLTPASGTVTGGTTVKITGTNFNGATSVTFGGPTTSAARWTFTSPTKIIAKTEPHVAGEVAVSVSTHAGRATKADAFTYVTVPVVPWKVSESYPTAPAPDIQDLSCASTGDCFAVGATTFFATADGGETWSTTPLPSSVSVLFGVSCPSSNKCIAVGQGTATTAGEGPIVAITNNAGATWTVSQLSSNESAGLNSISCGSTTDCVAVGSGSAGGVEYSTADGGSTWASPTTPPPGAPSLTSVSCASTSDCIAVGERGAGPVATKTIDGGLIWIDQTVSAPESVGLNSISCASTTDCVAVGSGSSGGVVFATADGGTAWAAPTTPLPGNLYLDAVSCAKGTTRCVAVGSGNESYDTTAPLTAWTLHTTSTAVGLLFAVACPSSDDCFAGGASLFSGIIVQTIDGGTTWSVQTLPFGVGGSYLLQCATPTTCYSVSFSTTGVAELVTVTSGASWSLHTLPTGITYVAGLSCPTASTCYARAIDYSLNKWVVLATVDGGSSWSVQGLPSGVEASYDISCPTASTCYATAYDISLSNWVVLATTDGGSTWSIQDLPSGVEVSYDIFCPAAGTCYATAYDYSLGTYIMLATTDGGSTWSTQRLPSRVVPSGDIVCPTASNCYVTAYGNATDTPSVIATTDGGNTWSIETLPTEITSNDDVFDISCPTATTCYAATYDNSTGSSTVIATTDGGYTWSIESLPDVTRYIDSISCLTANLCFAGGSNVAGGALILSRAVTAMPTITSLAPASGTTTGGTKVTITGAHLTGASKVLFGSVPATTVQVASPTKLTAKTPTHAAGEVKVSVTTPGGTGEKSTAFTFVTPPPTVTSLTPANGPDTGGTKLTIDGAHFTGTTRVMFGGTPAASYSVGSATTISATTPAHGTGKVSVLVHTTHGTATLDTAFEFEAPTPAASTAGYDMVGSDGGVFVFSPKGTSGGYFGSLPQTHITPAAPIVGMVPTTTDQGYFLVGADGGVFSFGNAPFLGSLPGLGVTPFAPIAGIVAANTDTGYFLVGKDGGVFAFGHVPFLGSVPGQGVSVDNIIGIASTPSGSGYWLVSATGAVYAFGAAKNLGTAKGTPSAVSAIAGTPTGGGYWITTQNGGVYNFGNAAKFSTLPAVGVTPSLPVIGIVHTADTGGYWLIGADGGIFAFGDAGFVGSLPGLTVHAANIVGAVPTT